MSDRLPSTITRALDEHLAAALRSRCSEGEDTVCAARPASAEVPTVPAMPTGAALDGERTRLGWTRRGTPVAGTGDQPATVQLRTAPAPPTIAAARRLARDAARGSKNRRRQVLRAAGGLVACIAIGLCALLFTGRQPANGSNAIQEAPPSSAASAGAARAPLAAHQPQPTGATTGEVSVEPRPGAADAEVVVSHPTDASQAAAVPGHPTDAAQAEEITRRAAIALAAGNYATALASYRALATGGDDGPVHAEIVRILTLRVAEHCGPDCESERAR